MPRKAEVFVFEGREMTMKEIHAMVSAVSKSQIKVHLAAGRNTRSAILNYRHKPKRHAPTAWASINRAGIPGD